MKVDLGQCAVCGAKNSKYVANCYKCSAVLPWAPGYVAPKNAPQTTAPSTAATATDNDAKTVVIAPLDEAKLQPTPAKTQVRSKATIGFGLLLIAISLATWAFLRTLRAPTTVVVAPTPITTPATLAPIAPIAPATDATASPTVAPTTATTDNTAAVAATPPVTESEAGPSFDELYANLTQGTPRQQQLYWGSVKGKKISWRGDFVSLGNAASGPLIVNCKSGTGTLKVTIALDATAPQTLPKYTINQSVPFEGFLGSRGAGGVGIKDGRAN